MYINIHTHSVLASVNFAFHNGIFFATRSAVLFLETLLFLLGNQNFLVNLNMTS